LTDAPQAAPLALATVDEAIEIMREQGLRLSTPRRLILEALFAAAGPVSAVQISRDLSIEITSVYRNLEMLEEHGLVRHVHLAHGPGLYVLVGRVEHEYLYCELCEKVTPVAVAELDPVRDQIRQRFGHEASFTHFAIVGLCRTCAAGEQRHAPDSSATQ
jgi:Fur family transcriptional regulator, ferric uptake regulator